MNIFEDLIDELKEENLLEETVIKAEKAKGDSNPPSVEISRVEMTPALQAEEIAASNLTESSKKSGEENSPAAKENLKNDSQFNSKIFETEPKTSTQSSGEAEYYRKRAVEEVAFLQMVEHVFAGIEREQMKIAPKPYDDLEAKKVLHSFLQVSGDVKSPEHAQLEFRLMQETESWYSALSHRDKRISVAHLRRYCEMARPPLSSPALIALGRFYRNSPFSEQVRSKFDLVLTKLFTKDGGGEKRNMVFSRDELIKHLNELYADWSSIPLYSTDNDEDNSEILLAALKFEDFMAETDAAENFDQLVRNDFFNRVRGFKQSTNEQFFAPLVTAAAIESNVRIGNRYVELLNKEREKGESAQLEDKYGFLHDQVISDATSKTLQLAELLKERSGKSDSNVKQKDAAKTELQSKDKTIAASSKKHKSGFFGVSKWLLAATVIAVIASFSLYFWANYQSSAEKLSQNVKKVNLENSMLKEYIGDARISNETFFGIVLPSWSGLTRERKEDILKKIVAIGGDKGFKNVHLLDKEGKTAASASKENLTVNNL